MRRSRPTASATATTSAPVASQTFAISLMKLTRVMSAAFEASFTISADATSVRTTRASIPSWSAATTSASASSKAPITIRSGCMKSRTAVPSAVNSGFDAYPTFSRPRSSRRWRTARPVPTGTVLFIASTTRRSTCRELVDHRPDVGEVRISRVRRRSADCDVDDVGAVDRLRDLGRERQPRAVAREELVEPRLVDRNDTRAQRVDLRLDDVADDDVVPELREAGAGDEAHVPRAEDRDLHTPYRFFTEPRGFRPLAMASIVSFDSRSSSVLTTQ